MGVYDAPTLVWRLIFSAGGVGTSIRTDFHYTTDHKHTQDKAITLVIKSLGKNRYIIINQLKISLVWTVLLIIIKLFIHASVERDYRWGYEQ